MDVKEFKAKQRAAKKATALIDSRIERAYRAQCCNIQINLMDIPKVFKVGRDLIATGADDAALADGVRAYVETIRYV